MSKNASQLSVRVHATNPLGSDAPRLVAEGLVEFGNILTLLSAQHFDHAYVGSRVLKVSKSELTLGSEYPMLDKLGLTSRWHTGSPWYVLHIELNKAEPDENGKVDATHNEANERIFSQLLNMVNALAAITPWESSLFSRTVRQQLERVLQYRLAG